MLRKKSYVECALRKNRIFQDTNTEMDFNGSVIYKFYKPIFNEKKFAQVPYARFRKNEFRNLITEVITVVDKYDVAAMFIKIMFDRLVTASAQLEALHVRYGSHPQTKELATVREKCSSLVKIIAGQIKNMQMANLDSQAVALAQVAPFVNRYLKPIVKSNWVTKSDILTEMFGAMSNDTRLRTGIDELNLNVYFNELKMLFESQQTIKETRSNSLATRNKVNTAGLRALGTTNLLELFAAIELAQIEHPETDYTTMINNINEILGYYSSQIKTRSTLGKKADENLPNAEAKINVA